MVIVVSLPECDGCLGPLDVFVRSLLLVMALQVTVCHNVVLTQTRHLDHLAPDLLWLLRQRSFAGLCKVMFLHADIADNVVVSIGVFSWAEVPLLLLRVVRPGLQALHFVLEVQDVERLLVPQLPILPMLIKLNDLPCFGPEHR